MLSYLVMDDPCALEHSQGGEILATVGVLQPQPNSLRICPSLQWLAPTRHVHHVCFQHEVSSIHLARRKLPDELVKSVAGGSRRFAVHAGMLVPRPTQFIDPQTAAVM